jgi:hypothetical protein
MPLINFDNEPAKTFLNIHIFLVGYDTFLFSDE